LFNVSEFIMRIVTAYDLGVFAAQTTTQRQTAHGLGAHVVNVKTAADYERVRSGSGRFPGVMPDEPAPAGVPVQQARAPVQRAGSSELARKEINPFVIKGRVNADQIAARDRAVAGLARPSLDKEYAASGFSGFRLKPVGEYGQASGGATFPLEYQIVATGPDGQEQLINTIKSRNAQTEPNLNPSNINKMVQEGAQRLGMKAGPKPPAPRPQAQPKPDIIQEHLNRWKDSSKSPTGAPNPNIPPPVPQPAPAPAAPAPAPAAPAPAAQAPAPAAPAPAPVAPAAAPEPAPAPAAQAEPVSTPAPAVPPPSPEPASAPTPATLDPSKITQLRSSLVTPETRTKVNPGWPTPRTTALTYYHEKNPKLGLNGPGMYADPSEQYFADMLNNNLMPRADTWEQRPDGSFRSDNTEQSHAYAQPTLRMADEVRREQAAVGNNPADYPEQVPAAPPEPESSIVSSRDVSRESAPLDPLPGVDDSILPSPSINDLGFSDPSYVPPTATPTSEPTYSKKPLTRAQQSVGNVGAFSEAGVAKTRTINDLGFADANYVPPPATPTSEPTYGKKPLTRAQQSVGNVGAFSEAGVAKTRKEDQRKAKLAPAPAPATAAPTAPSVPVTPPQPPIPTPEQPKPTPPPVPPPAPEPAPTPAPAAPQYRPSAPAAPAYRPPAQAAPAPRQTIGGGLFGRRRR
jgi:hypothetical protein